MMPVTSLMDFDAADAWLRSVEARLGKCLDSGIPGTLDVERLLWLCATTRSYDLSFRDVKLQALLWLLDELESFVVEFPGVLPVDVAVPARALIRHAERRRFLNG
jgi:hypothetical protein